MILHTLMMPSYLWSLIYDHNDLVLSLLNLFWNQTWTLWDSFSYLREGGNPQVLPQKTTKFSLRTVFIFPCRLDIPDMYILLFLCYSQHRHVCKWIRRWLGITLTKAIPYRKWIYFQILVGERKKSIFPRQVTKNDPVLTFNSISVPHKTCWKRSDLVTFPNPISNGIKQSK